MESLVYIDRLTGKKETEKVYGGAALKFIYGDDWVSTLLGTPLLHALIRNPIFSKCYGFWQKTKLSKRKIIPFIEHFGVDASEFQEAVASYQSFNDFFIRKLKISCRPIAPGHDAAVMPADGRYRFYPHIANSDGFLVKGEKFDLKSLLDDRVLANRYENGSMVMARLCPTDYHRFHFPCDCIPGESRWINGWLYSVNPIALKKDIHIFSRNKRRVCELETSQFGKVLYVEIGATSVGSIIETYTPFKPYLKGEEKGYFSFGASSLLILFEPSRMEFDPDLLTMSKASDLEIRCLMGQSLGKASA